ncbi:unnamed protein product [Leptidea sinapis]|uniref:Uncharacterized protein n=1 Tax=Leptidea sinapis TaxID=189913 RepID=A0A5E4QTQ4_9NEOP|nr:unnamed protein product [Leptidea sinapis]
MLLCPHRCICISSPQ